MTHHSVCVLYMVGEQIYYSYRLVYLVLHVIFSAPECFGVEFFGKTIRGACSSMCGVWANPEANMCPRFQTALQWRLFMFLIRRPVTHWFAVDRDQLFSADCALKSVFQVSGLNAPPTNNLSDISLTTFIFRTKVCTTKFNLLCQNADVLAPSDLLRSIVPVRLTTRLTDIILTHYNLTLCN